MRMVEAEGKQRKFVGRTVAIVLVIVCVVLSAGLIAAVAVYLPTESTIARLNSENAGLKGNMTVLIQQIVNLQSVLAQSEGSISDKDNQIGNLTEEVNGLLNILYLNVEETPISNQGFSLAAGENFTVWAGGVDYAGYFAVSVESSSNTTSVQIVYSSLVGINFDQTIIVGTSGIAGFPVLPADSITVIIGNTELVDSVNGTITVIYKY